MAERVPAVGVKVDFHVAGARRGVPKLDDCAAEIRAAFAADESGVKNPHRLAVQGFQLLAEQVLVLPDGLEQLLGWRRFAFAQDADAAALQTEPGIVTRRIMGHLALLLRGWRGNVKLACDSGVLF